MIDPVDAVTRPLPVATDCPIRIRFACFDRLYTVVLMKDLFDQWVIVQAWGGKYHLHGGSKTRPVDNLEAGLAALEVISRRRKLDGYQLLD
jgi:hypothetical protein